MASNFHSVPGVSKTRDVFSGNNSKREANDEKNGQVRDAIRQSTFPRVGVGEHAQQKCDFKASEAVDVEKESQKLCSFA